MDTGIRTRPSWDEYFLAMLSIVKLRASCPRRQGGAIIVDELKRFVGIGYNGPPYKLPNCSKTRSEGIPCPGIDDQSGDTTKCIALHAEHNAIFFSGDRIDLADTMYCTTEPCKKCALEILQTSIKRVVYLEDYPTGASSLLREAGIACFKMEINNDRF